MPMNEITRTKTDALMGKMVDTLSYLYCRWQDEKEYEQFSDYVTRMKTVFANKIKDIPMNNAVFVKGQKRPFGFQYDFEGWKVTLSVNSTEIKWKANKL